MNRIYVPLFHLTNTYVTRAQIIFSVDRNAKDTDGDDEDNDNDDSKPIVFSFSLTDVKRPLEARGDRMRFLFCLFYRAKTVGFRQMLDF